jgi:hypothetical protein
LTQNASRDSLSDQDYRDIYQEVRGYDDTTGAYRVSLDNFVTQIGSQFSKALWSKYHNGHAELNRTMRNELRAAVGLDRLPLTLGEAVAGVDPDARVVQIGDRQPDQVLLIGAPGPLRITVNGEVRAEQAAALGAAPRPARAGRRLVRPVASSQQDERRQALGRSWGEIIDAGLAVLEGAQSEND